MNYNELHINVTQIDTIQLWDFHEMYNPYYVQTEDVPGLFGLWTKMKKGLYESYFSFHAGSSRYRLSPVTTEKEINEFLDERNSTYNLEDHIIYKDGLFQCYPRVKVNMISGKHGGFGFRTIEEAREFVDELTSLNQNVVLIDSK